MGMASSFNYCWWHSRQDTQCMYNVTMTSLWVTIVAVENLQVLHILCVCVALCIQHAKHMCCITLSVACLILPYFPHIISWTVQFSGGGGGVIEHKICVLILSTTFVWNIPHFMKNSERYYHKSICLHVKYLLFLSVCHKTRTLLTVFQKNPQILQNVIKSQPVGAEMFHTDRWMDRQTWQS
jgi:hypothetical protein